MRSPAAAPAVLWIIPLVYFVFVGAEFAALTHLALEATAAGRSALAVGLLATGLWAGILLASARAHAAVQRHGPARVFVAATALAWAAMATMPWHASFPGWVAACFVLGLGGGMVWVTGEAWLAEEAPPERRGFYVGLFETAVGLGIMAGPAVVPLTRALGWPTLVCAAALMAVALTASVPLLRGAAAAAEAARATGAGGVPVAWRGIAAPLVAIAVVSGLMEAGVSALLPSVSMRLGFPLEQAAWLGTVIGAGSALLQPPAGYLADRWNVRSATLLAWALVMVANIVLLAFAASPAQVLWGVGFALGGVGGAVYTLMIVELGHRLAGSALVKAIGLLVTGYAVGTAVGPALGGAVFDAGGLRALAALLLALGCVGLLVTLRALGRGAVQRAPSAGPT